MDATDSGIELGMSLDDSVERMGAELSKRQAMGVLDGMNQARMQKQITRSIKTQQEYASVLGESVDNLVAFTDQLITQTPVLTSSLLRFDKELRGNVIAGITDFGSTMRAMGGEEGGQIAQAMTEAAASGAMGFSDSMTGYVRALPSELKLDEKFSELPKTKHKYLQKKSYEGLLPDYILNHRKTGWRFPTDEILIGRMDQPAPDKGVLKDYIRETLNDKELMDIFEYGEKDIEDRYLNNREHKKNEKGTDKAGPGLKSQKELFCTLNFAVWKKVYNMSL